MTADEFYKLGNEYRRKGDWQHALDNYLEAIALDPQRTSRREDAFANRRYL